MQELYRLLEEEQKAREKADEKARKAREKADRAWWNRQMADRAWLERQRQRKRQRGSD